MEICKVFIITVIVVIALCGAIYSIYLINCEQKKENIYVYPKNGHQYMPLYRCRMKCPASGEWFDALIYQDCKTENLYVRDRKDFLDKFVKLTEWENDKGRGSNGLDTHSD